MLTALWSVKGGQGVSVTAALVAQAASKSAQPNCPTLLVDLRGDQAAIFGLSEMEPGLSAWADSDRSTQLLERSLVDASSNLSLLNPGHTPLAARRAKELAEYLASREGDVVVDLGAPSDDDGIEAFRQAIIDRADESVLVTRQCYLALRRTVSMDKRPTKMVVITEPGRALPVSDCERAVGTKAAVTLPLSPDIARSVDAGMTRKPVPKETLRMVEQVLPSPPEPPPVQGNDTAPQNGLEIDTSTLSPSFGSGDTKGDKREAIRLRRAGHTHKDIGRTLGMSKSWAQQVTKGVPRGRT